MKAYTKEHGKKEKVEHLNDSNNNFIKQASSSLH
jgi:hypothetical protein